MIRKFSFQIVLEKDGSASMHNRILQVLATEMFKINRDICLGAYSFDIIDDTELVLLYDLHKSKNPDIPYWRYEKFDLKKLNDDQCKVTFR